MVETYTKEERISDRVQELVQEGFDAGTLTTYDSQDELMRVNSDGSYSGEMLIGFEVQLGDYSADPDTAGTLDWRRVFITLEALTALYTQAHADVEAGRIDGAEGLR
jgi:hypothetical protein